MQDAEKCPLCSQATVGRVRGGAGGYYEFNCPTCEHFDMEGVIFRRMSKGEHASKKQELIEFIKATPDDEIAYIGQRQEGDNMKALYCKRRPR